MINDALTVLERMLSHSASAAAVAHFQRLFNLGPEPQASQVRLAIGIYNQICEWLTSPTARTGSGILCLTQGTGQCDGRYLGSAACDTDVTTAGPINLCPDGISSDGAVTAETIIHEAAHRFGVCPSPTGRGFPTARALRTSADSYSAFAREAHGLMSRERLRESGGGLEERPITWPPGRRPPE
jgi:hypothetical protein